MFSTKIALNDHVYYCSKGLKRAETIYQGPLRKELDEDYGNEYVKIKTVRNKEEAQAYFTAQEGEAAQRVAEGDK